jgi:hypothetical protein
MSEAESRKDSQVPRFIKGIISGNFCQDGGDFRVDSLKRNQELCFGHNKFGISTKLPTVNVN